MKSKNIIFKTLEKRLHTLILLFSAIIVGAILKIFSPLIVRNIIDNVLPILSDGSLGLWVSLFAVVIVLSFATEVFIKDRTLYIGTEVSNDLAKAVFSSAIRAESGELKKVKTDDVINVIGEDCTTIGNKYIGRDWLTFIQSSLFLFTVFITMMILDAALGLLTYVTLPLVYMIVKTTEKHIAGVNIKAEEEQKDRCNTIRENIEKIRSIKLKNGVIYEEDIFNVKSERFFKQYRGIQSLSETVNFKLYDLFIGLALAIILGLGGHLTLNNQSSAGTVVAFVIFIPQVYMTYKRLMEVSINFKNIENELGAIDDILVLRSEVKAEPVTKLEDVHSLRFDSVSYYSGDDRLENISFELKRGEKLGIISVNGNGQDVLFDLFTKLVRPRDGEISINNCDINKINTFYLRDLITAIPQDDTLFDDSIINNISYPFPFDEYKYNDALHKSGLKNIVATLEDKDQTVIERLTPELLQRITLANAFYKDSKIFIFNEATSSLDVRDEDAIMNEIFKLKNKIVVLMTEKIYYIAKCDKVLVLDDDQVVEYGRTADLLQDRNSLYSKLLRKVKKVS